MVQVTQYTNGKRRTVLIVAAGPISMKSMTGFRSKMANAARGMLRRNLYVNRPCQDTESAERSKKGSYAIRKYTRPSWKRTSDNCEYLRLGRSFHAQRTKTVQSRHAETRMETAKSSCEVFVTSHVFFSEFHRACITTALNGRQGLMRRFIPTETHRHLRFPK